MSHKATKDKRKNTITNDQLISVYISINFI